MARQRVRRIVVDGRTYRWRVRQVDESFVDLRLWRDGDRLPMADVRLRFDDPWLWFPELAHVTATMPDRRHELYALDPVRPHQVAELIRGCVKHTGPGRVFEVIGGELRPVPGQVP